MVGTSRTDNDSTTNPENCQFLESRGFRGRSVIGVLRILTNPEICQFLAILGIRGRSVIGALGKSTALITGRGFKIMIEYNKLTAFLILLCTDNCQCSAYNKNIS